MNTKYTPIIKTMFQAAQKGCKVIEEIYNSQISGDHIIEKQGSSRLKDFQSLADTQTEVLIQEILHYSFPDIGFLGEESFNGDISDFANAPYFILDPLDGTSNFISGRDYFGISLAYVEAQTVKIGLVANPVTGDIVVAEDTQGCFYYPAGNKTGLRLPTIPHAPLENLQIDFELPFTKHEDIELMRLLTPHSRGMRKHGSTAIDIAFMAKGRKSVLIASNQKPYDIAAALIIAQEIGLQAKSWNGEPARLNSDNIVIANEQAMNQLLQFLINGA